DKELEDDLAAEDAEIVAELAPAPAEAISADQIAGALRRIAAQHLGRDAAILERAAHLVADRERLLGCLRWRLEAGPGIEQARAALPLDLGAQRATSPLRPVRRPAMMPAEESPPCTRSTKPAPAC